MLEYKTPGVYVEEINSLPRAISAVATAVPVFVGYTGVQVGSKYHLKPTRITSMLEYVEKFNTAPPTSMNVKVVQTVKEDDSGIKVLGTSVSLDDAFVNVPEFKMYYALQLYFMNGGGPCYIYSIGDHAGAQALNDYVEGFATLEEYDEPTLIVLPDAGMYADTDMTDYGSILSSTLIHCNKMQDRFLIADSNVEFSEIDTLRGVIPTEDYLRKYGAVYFPNVVSNLDFVTVDSDITISEHTYLDQNGSSVAVPAGSDLTSKTLDSDAFVTYDADEDEYIGTDENQGVYFAVLEAIQNQNMVLPPSSAIAGLYAQTDANRGVWKAPANVSLKGVVEPSEAITNEDNGLLNVDTVTPGKSINAIRKFTGKGNLVWGARTLNGEDLNWRFINVRREVMFIEESIKKALEHYVFEPNTASTWAKVNTMITSFLKTIWKAGGLAGERPEDAFSVSIGLNQTMTATDVASGLMIVEVSLVPPRPAEVIVLRVSQKLQVS